MTATDPEAAVAACHAAGDDVEALGQAVQAASWLESKPGDHRQKFRGACAESIA